MIQIGNTIISKDLFDCYFVCDLSACKGACCVEGDTGAPLTHEEAHILEEIYDKVKPYLSEKGIKSIEIQGVAIEDPYEKGALTTPLIDGKECAFTVFDKNGTAKCGIEKAYRDGKIDFLKPLSCHLYPVRVKKYVQFEALNYDRWKICNAACDCGAKLQLPLYQFLKEPLIRAYGEEWFADLEIVAKEIKNNSQLFS